MRSDLIDRIDRFLGEGKFLGWKKKAESITTVSAGVPGDGPIADVQNGLSGQTQEFKDANKKNRRLVRSLLRRRPKEDDELDESVKIEIDDIIDSLGGVKEIKKMGNSFNVVWNKVLKKMDLVKDTFNISNKDIDMNELKARIKEILV